MATFINTNLTSLSTQNVLSKSQNALSTSIHRLATGLRVNSAIDDASGYAIANRLNSQLRGQTVAIRNTNEAISYSQFQEAGLNQFNNNLQRMRELAVQSSSGTIGENERNLLNAEFLQLQQEIERVQKNSYYNGTNAMGDQSITVQVGAYSSKFDQVQVAGIKLDKLTQVTNMGSNATLASGASGATAAGGTQTIISSSTITTPAKATTYTQAQFNEFIKQDGIASHRADYYFNATNGHIYEFVSASSSWTNASEAAATKRLTGVTGVEDQQGYLTTITSGSENSFVQQIVAQRGTAWINVNDATTEGNYVVNSTAPAAEQGKITYSNWQAGEPNNLGNEDYTQMYSSGTWNDLPESSRISYIVEYGGKTQSVATTQQIQSVKVVSVDTTALVTQTQTISGVTYYGYKNRTAAAITQATLVGTNPDGGPNTVNTGASVYAAASGSTAASGTFYAISGDTPAASRLTGDVAAGATVWSTVKLTNLNGLATIPPVPTTALINNMYQYQTNADLALTNSNTVFKDQFGQLITTTVKAGDFVYTTNLQDTTSLRNNTLDVVESVGNVSAVGTQSLISGNAGGINILTQKDSQDAISLIDAAMEQVQVAQIQSGATQARLGAIVNSLTATNESLTAARSSIMDTDYAAETANLARAQILGQAGISMLAQANQLGQNVLKLLQ